MKGDCWSRLDKSLMIYIYIYICIIYVMYHVFEGRGKAPKTKREKGKLPETKRKRENGNQQTLRSNSFREASRPRALTHARNETIARLSAPNLRYSNTTM